MKNSPIIILFLIVVQTVLGQVNYSGPATGSVASGISVSTGTVPEAPANPNGKFRLFNHFKPDFGDGIGQQVKADAPEGSNSITYSEVPIGRDEQVVLFEDFYGIGQTNSIPPDPYLAVGEEHIIQVVNTNFRITTKTGQSLKYFSATSWFNSVLPGCDPFDCKVLYDQIDERWVMVWLNINEAQSTAHYLVSVSDDSNPIGTWYNWALPSTTNGSTPSGTWGDYQGVGYDDKAIYLTSNQFTFAFSYSNTKLRILPKSDFYQNSTGSVSYTDIWNITYPNTSNTDAFGLRPVRMQTLSDDYYFAVNTPYTAGTNFGIYKLLNPITNPSLTGSQVSVTYYSTPPDPDQLGGGSPKIDGGGFNLRNEPVYKDGILHLTHSVRNGNASDLRYLSINVSNYTKISDWTFGDGVHFHTYPALAVNEYGDVLFTFSRSSASEYMGAYYTVLKNGESTPIGIQQLKAGNGNYVKTYGGSRNRWGDYNGAWMDPADPQSFWMLTEYVHSTNTWGVWVGGVRVENSTAVTWDMGLTVKDNGNQTGNLTFGLAPYATDGIDDALGEAVLGNPTPGSFDARFILPGNEGSLKDYRDDENETVSWKIDFQPGSGGYPITLTWNNASLPVGDFFLTDNSGSLVNINMKQQNSYTLTNTSITELNINYDKKYSSTINSLSGWNIISVPVLADDMTVETIFPNAASAAFKYDNGYQVVDEFVNGLGYWIKFDDAGSTPVEGVKVDDDIELMAGWNIIGPFETSVNIDDISTQPSNIINSAFFGFNGAYVNTDNLEPGKGYWIKTSQSGTMSFNSVMNKASIAKNEIAGNAVKLIFSTDKGNTFTLYASNNSKGNFELPPMPPAGNEDIRFADNTYLSNISTEKNIILNGIEKFTLEVEGGDVFMNIEGNNTLVKSGNKLTLSGTNSLSVQFAEIPVSFSLEQNFPNPFNPSTKIKFNLASNQNVLLNVYNVLGEKIKNLINENLEAGSYEVEFNASDLPSGIYFYEISSEGFTETKKMMLVK